MDHEHTRTARTIAGRIAAELAGQGTGVALTGSVATGSDHPHSDIDLYALAETEHGDQIRSVEGRLTTITWTTPARVEAAFTDPATAGAAVPAWRDARILADPTGALAAVCDRARHWEWTDLTASPDRWAAERLVGLAEEAHKIHGMLTTGRLRAAAARLDTHLNDDERPIVQTACTLA